MQRTRWTHRAWQRWWLLFALATAVPAWGATWLVGAGSSTPRLADALRRAADGDTILVASGDYHGDVGVIHQKRLTIRGVGTRPVFHADGQHAEGKAQLVLRDGEVLIENIAFTGTRVPSGNGAGIRFERGHLTLRRCAFTDNQIGLLTNNDESAELVVEDSEFGMAPGEPGRLEHLLYVGRIAALSVTGSRFYQGHTGHLLKSRARRSLLAYNRIVDGPLGSASYEVEFPNGGQVTLIGNTIGQSAATQNPAVVSYGAEGGHWPDNMLVLAYNTLLSPAVPGAVFLRFWSERLPADSLVHAINNLTLGPVALLPVGPGLFAGNVALGLPVLPVLPTTAETASDFAPDAAWRGRAVAPRLDNGTDLAPKAEFSFPAGTRPLAPPRRWSAGAFQSDLAEKLMLNEIGN